MNMISVANAGRAQGRCADYVIENNGSLDDLERDVDALRASSSRCGTSRSGRRAAGSNRRRGLTCFEARIDFAPGKQSAHSPPEKWQGSRTTPVHRRHERAKGKDGNAEIGIPLRPGRVGRRRYVELRKSAPFGKHDVYGTIEAVKAVSGCSRRSPAKWWPSTGSTGAGAGEHRTLRRGVDDQGEADQLGDDSLLKAEDWKHIGQ
jgi:hypothetical protein